MFLLKENTRNYIILLIITVTVNTKYFLRQLISHTPHLTRPTKYKFQNKTKNQTNTTNNEVDINFYTSKYSIYSKNLVTIFTLYALHHNIFILIHECVHFCSEIALYDLQVY